MTAPRSTFNRRFHDLVASNISAACCLKYWLACVFNHVANPERDMDGWDHFAR